MNHRRSGALFVVCAGLLAACSSAAPGRTTTPTPAPSASPTATPLMPSPSPAPSATSAPSPTTPPSVPTGFAPTSVTFVSTSMGFVLGTFPCNANGGSCLALLRTSDAGHTWSPLQAPPTKPSQNGGNGVQYVRFANAQTGWVFGTELWVTRDGGAHWHKPALPAGTNGPVQGLEVGAGAVHAAVVGNDGIDVDTSPAATDAWTRAMTIPFGAGPIPQGQITLSGSAGWAVEVDRTVVGGARLISGHWSAWTPPCSSVAGPASLAAATTSRLVAACDEGEWSAPAGVHLWFSSDGGSTFQRVAAAVSLSHAWLVTLSTSGVVVVGGYNTGGSGQLVASFNSGASWTVVYSGVATSTMADLGFTTSTQGIAIVGTHLVMTFDGGHHWNPVAFS